MTTGDMRMCLGFCPLNAQTVKNCYLLPRIDKPFDKLHNASVFSGIDLQSAYK